MRTTMLQRRILSLLHEGYRLGSYFAPPGKWSLARIGHTELLIQERTVRSMHRKGLIAGNIYWPYVTADGWQAARTQES